MIGSVRTGSIHAHIMGTLGKFGGRLVSSFTIEDGLPRNQVHSALVSLKRWGLVCGRSATKRGRSKVIRLTDLGVRYNARMKLAEGPMEFGPLTEAQVVVLTSLAGYAHTTKDIESYTPYTKGQVRKVLEALESYGMARSGGPVGGAYIWFITAEGRSAVEDYALGLEPIASRRHHVREEA